MECLGWFIAGLVVNASITALWIFALCYWGFIRIEWIDRTVDLR